MALCMAKAWDAGNIIKKTQKCEKFEAASWNKARSKKGDSRKCIASDSWPGTESPGEGWDSLLNANKMINIIHYFGWLCD